MMFAHPVHIVAAFGLAGALVVGTPAAAAQEVEAGWEGRAGEGFAYLNWLRPVAPVGRGAIVVTIEASHLYYVDDALVPGRIVRVRSPGIAGGLGVRHDGTHAGVTATAGLDARRTWSVSTFHAPASVGAWWLGVLWVEPTSRTLMTAVGRSSGAANYRWGRVGLVQRVIGREAATATAALSIGLEVTGDETEGVRSSQAGGVMVLDVARRGMSLELRLGRSRGADPLARPYWGLSLVREW